MKILEIKCDDGNWITFGNITKTMLKNATVVHVKRGGRHPSRKIEAFLSEWGFKIQEH